MHELQQDAIATLLKAGQVPSMATINCATLNNQQIPVLFTPDGYTAKLMPELEKHLPSPLRKTSTVQLDDAESFIWYLQEHGDAESCRIYLTADYQSGKVQFLALLNDNTKTGTNWRDHRATFTPAKSVEWNRWVGANKKQMTQTEFANWIEDNMADIAEIEGMPKASEMLEMALNFEATAEKKFKSATRLQSGGISMEYIDTEDSATRARMAVFERFSLGLTALQDGPAYRLDARMKYRLRDGTLHLWFELIRPDKVLENSAHELVNAIKEKSGFPLLLGNPFAQ